MTEPTTQGEETYGLAKLIYEASQADEQTISAMGAGIIAAKIVHSDWLAQREADAIRNAADYMEDIGNGYYQMLAVDDLYEKADYMDGTKP